MSLLEITGLSHAFGDTLLYKEAAFTLNKGEHIGVVGQNGTGKSSLIKICTGQLIPDKGQISWAPKTNIGYLDQYAKINYMLTIRAFLKTAFSELYALEDEMNEFYMKAAQGSLAAIKQASKCQEKLEARDFYSIENRIDQVANGLGLAAFGSKRLIGSLSGGQRTKVILAKLLLEKPDVLLLDEPTNFLDKEHVSWLADYLAGLENTVMVVSHDGIFLDKIANRICDIDYHQIKKYYGTYSEFLKKKASIESDYVRHYAAQQKQIKQTEEFIRKNIAGRKSKMARGRQKQLNRMEKLEVLEKGKIKPRFCFPELPLSSTEHLMVEDLVVGYDSPVLSDVHFSIKGGQKVVVTGFNGVGKSTLLKTLVGELPALAGGFTFSKQVKESYFEQDLHWQNDNRTPLQIISEAHPTMPQQEVRRHLACCGITSKHAMQIINTLSGGEQGKVKLCLMTLRSSNFLILDEPTNHLDAQAKEALKEALMVFSGTVLLVSHEEAFYRGWVQQIIDVAQVVYEK